MIREGARSPLLTAASFPAHIHTHTPHLLASKVSVDAALRNQEVTMSTIHTEVGEESCPILSALHSYF